MRASDRKRPHSASWGVIVEYMDRAREHTGDILSQTLRVTYTNPAKSADFALRNDPSDIPTIGSHRLSDARVGQFEVVAAILVVDQGHNRR